MFGFGTKNKRKKNPSAEFDAAIKHAVSVGKLAGTLACRNGRGYVRLDRPLGAPGTRRSGSTAIRTPAVASVGEYTGMIIAAAFFIGCICTAAILILVGLYLTHRDEQPESKSQGFAAA